MGLWDSVSSLFKKQGKLPEVQMSAEQKQLAGNQLAYSNRGVEAGQNLMDYMKTGKFAGSPYTMGEAYDGPLGNYDMTDIEGSGQDAMRKMINSGVPELNQLGYNEYRDLLTTDKYNPLSNENKDTYFNPYMKEIQKANQISSDRLNQEMGRTGSLYSSARDTQQRRLSEETNDQTNMLLSKLYQDYANKRLSGAQTAADMGQQKQSMELERINAAHEYGQLDRMLKDTQAKEAYNDWLRKRAEYADVINTAKSMYSTGAGVGFVSPTSAYDMANFTSKTNQYNYQQRRSDKLVDSALTGETFSNFMSSFMPGGGGAKTGGIS
jgi:hypothetical protein